MTNTPTPQPRPAAQGAPEARDRDFGSRRADGMVHLDDVREQRAIAAALRGEDIGFDTLYRAHIGPVARFVARSLGQTADTEDVVQDTFTTAFTTLDRFRGDSALRTWLMGIAWNHIRALWRTRQKLYPDKRSAADVTSAKLLSVHEWPQLVARERIQIIEQLLASMGQPARDVAILVLVHGATYAECADVLDLPVNTVASHVFRARKRILEAIEAADAGHRRGAQ